MDDATGKARKGCRAIRMGPGVPPKRERLSASDLFENGVGPRTDPVPRSKGAKERMPPLRERSTMTATKRRGSSGTSWPLRRQKRGSLFRPYYPLAGRAGSPR